MKRIATGMAWLMVAALVPAASAADLAQWTFETSVPTTAGPHQARRAVDTERKDPRGRKRKRKTGGGQTASARRGRRISYAHGQEPHAQ